MKWRGKAAGTDSDCLSHDGRSIGNDADEPLRSSAEDGGKAGLGSLGAAGLQGLVPCKVGLVIANGTVMIQHKSITHYQSRSFVAFLRNTWHVARFPDGHAMRTI